MGRQYTRAITFAPEVHSTILTFRAILITPRWIKLVGNVLRDSLEIWIFVGRNFRIYDEKKRKRKIIFYIKKRRYIFLLFRKLFITRKIYFAIVIKSIQYNYKIFKCKDWGKKRRKVEKVKKIALLNFLGCVNAVNKCGSNDQFG